MMLFLAIRHLVSRKKQTTLTLLGIVFGSAAFVAISGFMLGFQYYLLDQLINNDAHIRISAREDRVDQFVATEDLYRESRNESTTGRAHVSVFWVVEPSGTRASPKIENPRGWDEVLIKDPRVEAYSPQFSTQVLFLSGAISATGRMIGSEPDAQRRVTNIENYIKTGRFLDLAAGGNRIIVGTGLLKKLGAGDGSTVFVSTGRTQTPFKVIGTFETGNRQLDESTAFASLTDTQRLSGNQNEINNIAVRLLDFNRAREIAGDWQTMSVDRVESWDEINASFLNVFSIQDATRYLMIGIILLVAGFGIYNILNVVVSQKKREIAILRSIGYEQSDILRLFFYQGLILGIVGSAIGLVIGYVSCLGLEQIKFGGGPMGGGTAMKVSFDEMIYIRAFLFGSLSAAVASVLPARSAGKLTPIDIIRSGAE